MSDPRLLSPPMATGASDSPLASRGSEGKRSGFKSQAGTHDTVQDIKGELEDLVNMGDWELVGPMGSVAESVFKGKTLVEEEEVAIKVVSLNNSFLRDSKDCQEQLRTKCAGLSGQQLIDMEESIFRDKVIMENKMTNHLSFKHIYCFHGVYSSSCTYQQVVLDNPDHAAHRKENLAGRPLDQTGPFCFIVMEYLPGRDLMEYNWTSNETGLSPFGSLLHFDAAADATNEKLRIALELFWSQLSSVGNPEEVKKDVSKYVYANGCFIFDNPDGSRGIIIKLKNSIVELLSSLYPEPKTSNVRAINKQQLRRFSEQLRVFLCEQQVADSTGHAIDENNPRHDPPSLLMSESFVRTILKQTMLALAHAHGFSLYHSDLKPDNIMMQKKVHGHASDEHDICVKIIDWGCSGFSKEDDLSNGHMYLPPLPGHRGKYQERGPKFDVYTVGSIMRWLFSHKSIGQDFGGLLRDLSDGEWNRLYTPSRQRIPNPENPFSVDTKTFQCPWMSSRPPLPMEFRRPFNPCADAEFCDLLNGMLQINPDQRLSASQVLQHRFILRANHSAPAPEFDDSHHEDMKRVNEILYQFVAPSHMVGLKRKQSAEVNRLQNEEGVHDMAHSVLELISLDIFVLKKALDVLVAVSLLESAPLAHAFLRCGLAHKLGMLAREYHYMKMYTQRHLPRSAKLLVHIAGHQDRDMLRKIIAVEQFEKTRGDGRILFELMAYGTQVLDAEHRANCMYFMAVTFALSSADTPTEAQRDLSISTQDLVKFFRIDGVQQPEQLEQQVACIISMFVELLETLTWTREESVERRKTELKRLLEHTGSPKLHGLFNKKAKGDGGSSAPGTPEVDVDLDKPEVCKAVTLELQVLQHAVQPLHTSEHNLSFTHYFRDLFPDPESIFHSLHAALWDEGQRGFKQSSVHSSKSNRSDVLSCIIQVLLNLSKIKEGLKVFIEGEDSLYARTIRRLQILHHKQPFIFAKMFTRPLVEHVVRAAAGLPGGADAISGVDAGFAVYPVLSSRLFILER